MGRYSGGDEWGSAASDLPSIPCARLEVPES